MKRNRVIVKLQGCWIQKMGGKGHYENGELHHERLVVGKGSIVRELLGMDVRTSLMGVGPLKEAGNVRVSVAKQQVEFIACSHVRTPKLKRVISDALGISDYNFTLRLVKC